MQKSESQIGADFTDYTDFWGGSTLHLCNLRNLWQSAVLTITELQNVHYAQIINYLTAYKLEIGLLIIKS